MSLKRKMAQIVLTEKEKEVFGVIKAACAHHKLNTVVRAAGGWVRDKLLGLSSDDIDLAVDDMSGEEFAHKVASYVAEKQSGTAVSRVGVVKQNPDQSKHLATACFTVCGIALDVNNLRTETYTQDSRIPTTSIGTAEEDAYRRDFTLNALFYNLNDDCVEDLVSGLNDLNSGLIRTPLPAKETFRDDPLRVLRAVRFAARFEFRLDQGVQEAALMDGLHSDLSTKISRERVGVEVDKMVAGGALNRRILGLELLCKLGLYEPTFMPPKRPEGLPALSELSEEGLRIVRNLDVSDDIRLALYSAFLFPLQPFRCPAEKKPKPFAWSVLRNALKLPNEVSEQTGLMTDIAAELSKVAAQKFESTEQRMLAVGLLMRQAKGKWMVASKVAEAADGLKAEHGDLRAFVKESGLSACHEWDTFFDGKELMKLGVPGGKTIGVWKDKQIAWRLQNPTADKDACREWLMPQLAQ